MYRHIDEIEGQRKWLQKPEVCIKEVQKGEQQMETYTLGNIESRFADIVWENAPLTTG